MVMMIIVSDNTCTGHVVDVVGLGDVQRYTEAVGLRGTVHRYGIPPKTGADNTLDKVTITTANDQGMLLELILKGTTDPACRRAPSVHPGALSARPGHPLLAEAQDQTAVPAAARHEGRAQDRHGPPLLQRRRDHLQRAISRSAC
jgi:beta-lactamase class A